MRAPFLVETAHAKINLALHVTGRRADGYHNLESLVVFAGVADELRATPAPSDELSISGPFASALSSGETNLVARAVDLMRMHESGKSTPPLAIELVKNLPVAGGIGGGSADAAAAIRLALEAWGSVASQKQLEAIGLELGADVPACLYSRPCLVTGIGEQVTPVAPFPQCHVVLVNPMKKLVTSEIFRRLEQRENPGLPDIAVPFASPAVLGLWLSETRNDLESTARRLVPEIGPIIDVLGAEKGCIIARMSGSGATVFGLFGNGQQAHQCAHDLRLKWPDYWISASALVGTDQDARPTQ